MINKISASSKIGILGGTFNPIHLGHLVLAQNALEWCNLDKVLIIPSGISYLKDPRIIASAIDRIKMVELSIKSNNKFELSTIETDRSGNSYTFETLNMLEEIYKGSELYYIIGADTLFSIEKWVRPEVIFEKTKIICARRDKYTENELSNKVKELKDKFHADIILMDIPELDISSSMLRKLISEGKSARYYLNKEVSEYISVKGLYKA